MYLRSRCGAVTGESELKGGSLDHITLQGLGLEGPKAKGLEFGV